MYFKTIQRISHFQETAHATTLLKSLNYNQQVISVFFSVITRPEWGARPPKSTPNKIPDRVSIEQ